MEMIKIKNLTKTYYLYDKPSDRLLEAIHPRKKIYHKEFNALSNISFTVNKGENVGIIGHNGAGKSTLLKIINGLISPTAGEVEINGNISAIIELGAGFNLEYTGLENIYLNGLIKGMTRKEVDKIVDEVIEFSELGDFINQPVKTYSSGMYARLAFAVAINTNPDILIVDEALSVGDMMFQHKCMVKMKKMMEEGVTILFVSHDIHAVKSLCSKCVYIENGEMIAYGDSMNIVNLYLRKARELNNQSLEEISDDNQEEAILESDNSDIHNEAISIAQSNDDGFFNEKYMKFDDENRYGTGKARVVNFELLNSEGEETEDFSYGEIMTYKTYIKMYEDVEHLNPSLLIRDKNGVDITGTACFDEKFSFPPFKKGDQVIVEFKLANRLKHNLTFSVTISLNDTISYEQNEVIDHIDLAKTFRSVYNPNRPVWYTYYEDIDITYDIFTDKSKNQE